MAASLARWALSPVYPLSEQISSALPANLRARNQRRTNPVSLSLCDDVLARLAPSLTRYNNCDIIDVFPGASLWSSKVHKLINPRRHLLIEPDTREYQRFLDPLLQAPDSRYRHLAFDPLDLHTYDRIFDEDHLPEQTKGGTAGRLGLNNSLLVIANLTYNQEFTSRGHLLMRYMEACWDQTLFHRYGLVRILAMLPEEDVDAVLPKAIQKRKRTAVVGETVSRSIVEVATSAPNTAWWAMKGSDTLSRSVDQTAERAQKAELVSPPGREFPPITLAPQPNSKGDSIVQRPKHNWHDEVIALRSTRLKRPPKGSRAELQKDSKYAPWYELQRLNRLLAVENRIEVVVRKALEIQAEIDAHEQTAHNLAADAANPSAKLVKEVEAVRAAKERQAAVLDKFRAAPTRFDQFLEEERAFAGRQAGTSVPLLPWDRRPFEPLVIDQEELYPRSAVSILDFVPDPDSPMLQTLRTLRVDSDSPLSLSSAPKQNTINSNTNTEDPDKTYAALLRVFSHILGAFSMRGGQPLSDFLSLLFPGRSATDLITAVPELAPYATPTAFVPMTDRERMRLKQRAARAAVAAPDGAGATSADADDADSNPSKGVTARSTNDGDLRASLTTYDNRSAFSGVRLRALPVTLVWRLTVEWHRWPGKDRGKEGSIYSALGGGLLRPAPEMQEDDRLG